MGVEGPPAFSAPATIVLNLNILKGLPFLPILVPRKKKGPVEPNFTKRAIINNKGDKIISPRKEKTISKSRLSIILIIYPFGAVFSRVAAEKKLIFGFRKNKNNLPSKPSYQRNSQNQTVNFLQNGQ